MVKKFQLEQFLGGKEVSQVDNLPHTDSEQYKNRQDPEPLDAVSSDFATSAEFNFLSPRIVHLTLDVKDRFLRKH